VTDRGVSSSTPSDQGDVGSDRACSHNRLGADWRLECFSTKQWRPDAAKHPPARHRQGGIHRPVNFLIRLLKQAGRAPTRKSAAVATRAMGQRNDSRPVGGSASQAGPRILLERRESVIGERNNG